MRLLLMVVHVRMVSMMNIHMNRMHRMMLALSMPMAVYQSYVDVMYQPTEIEKRKKEEEKNTKNPNEYLFLFYVLFEFEF